MTQGTESEVQKAHATLRTAFDNGATRDVEARRHQLKQLRLMFDKEEKAFCDAVFKDLGKDRWEALTTELNMVSAEIQLMLDNLDKWSAPRRHSTDPIEFLALTLSGGATNYQYPDPYGVVLIMAPWNYPIHQMFMPLAGAIAAGNTALCKPASTRYAPHCAAVIEEMCEKYLDPEFVQVITGARDANANILKMRFDKIFFTGGHTVGRLVLAAANQHFTPVVLELGGQNTVIVDQHVDIDVAAKRIVWGKFTNCGQICITGNHMFVHEKVADKLIKAILKYIRTFYGDSTKAIKEARHTYGRIVNEVHFAKLKNKFEKDAKYVTHGGQADEKELFFEPTLLDFGSDMDAFMGSECMESEVFGPLLPFVRFNDIGEVIKQVNKLEKCLTLQLYTHNKSNRERVLTETSSGNAMVNDVLLHMVGPLPFGGVGYSGMGSYHHKTSFDTFVHYKTVMMRGWSEPGGLRFPPYTSNFRLALLSAAVSPRSHLTNSFLKLLVAGFMGLGIIIVAQLLPIPWEPIRELAKDTLTQAANLL